MSANHLDAVTRVIRILDYMMSTPTDVGVSELSRELGYSKSVVHRLLATLRAYDYVAIDEETRKYRLGFRALQLGLAAQARIDVRRIAQPRMERLRSITKETINLSIRVGERRIYIESLESPQELRQHVPIGQEMDLFRGSSSKAILAFLPPEQQHHVLQQAHGETTVSGETITYEGLQQDLLHTRQRGYALSMAERLAGTFSVAAPVFDHHGEVVASLSISGPSARWSEEAAHSYGALLIEETSGLSRDLGYDPNFAEHDRSEGTSG